MDENREHIPADEQETPIERAPEPAQPPLPQEKPEDLAQKIFDAEAATKPAEKYVYKWEYEQQRASDLARKKPRGGRSLWICVLLATGVCALCLGLVLGMLTYAVIAEIGGAGQTIKPRALESVRNYTVVISAKSADSVSTGTGFVLTQDGYIVTNYHVIEGKNTITVKFYNGQAAIAEVVGYSEIDDIAVIKVKATGLYTARIGRSAAVRDAQDVYAVGTPAGEEYAWSVTKGVVSFAQREVKIYDDEGILIKKMQLIQTDTPVNPGNSGGPLVNENGEVLGIITMKLSGQYENMGFAIPIDGAMVLIQNIIRTGDPGESPITTKRPLIGIVGGGVEAGKYYHAVNERQEEIPDQIFYADREGVMVLYLSPQMDASNKLRVGDIIVQADGRSLKTIHDLMDVVNEHKGGETVQLVYYRNGVANTVDVVLGSAD